jgi:hypothetical protein
MAALSLQVTTKDFRGPHSVEIYPLREEMTGKMHMVLVVLLCAAAVLLLIGQTPLCQSQDLPSRSSFRRKCVL